MILTHKQASHDDWDRLVPLEPRWWYPSTGALETMVVEQTTTMEGLMVQTAHDQVPPEGTTRGTSQITGDAIQQRRMNMAGSAKDHQTIRSSG